MPENLPKYLMEASSEQFCVNAEKRSYLFPLIFRGDCRSAAFLAEDKRCPSHLGYKWKYNDINEGNQIWNNAGEGLLLNCIEDEDK